MAIKTMFISMDRNSKHYKFKTINSCYDQLKGIFKLYQFVDKRKYK